MQTLKATFEFPIKTKYNWAAILNGSPQFLAEGTDYAGKRDQMKMRIRQKANSLGKGVQMANIDEGGPLAKQYKLKGAGIVVQAFDGTPEQVADWKKQAETRKQVHHAKAKAKREAAKAQAAASTLASTQAA